MRPGQQNKRGRGRNNNNGSNNNNNNRKGSNPLTRTYDSSGPDVKIRGTAQHIAEKYAALARDAQSAGDRVMAENYLQHAEHYNRIIAAAQAQMQDRFQREERQDYQDRDLDRDQDDLDQVYAEPAPAAAAPAQAPAPSEPQPVIDGSGPQPVIEGMPAEVAMEEETSVASSGRTGSRRRSASRPRRQPRRNAGDEPAAEGQPGGDAPVLAASE
ncbi:MULTISPECIES: DUF4167 domain-containing protein [Sinorhizobium]|uniref:DUF4167 domain-containing protein n=1 Tax=Sinorhizobium americanum TaxID=194963 RepID=A0A2S3YQD7_9HYPH|nr:MULTISPECIES: DUF4167 domain-containing protein [Sinorhizobium]ASY57910.1 Eukaryotic translation initiation factor 3 subunit 10 [Sinorhizobium sp. CCBAU 05631]PDT34266.1 DUF4167 domain-containing protein [Sinorhizobium sp. FG01]PDT48650.1 DUF4167 domain-containing protein [Sinorhizobium sp. NG07B]POH33049.1 hypothetical protein ATY30_03675 [Sinorhizobium americanum]POH33395.1 hypothetical protein ATY31_10915 [Sinorhizobium americanum]